MQNVSISFINNTAGLGGAAIYANDMSRCKWLGPEAKDFSEQFFIFSTPSSYRSPFFSRYVTTSNRTSFRQQFSFFQGIYKTLNGRFVVVIIIYVINVTNVS